MTGVQELLAAGTITDETLVWTEDMEEWSALGECKEALGLGEAGEAAVSPAMAPQCHVHSYS